MMNEEEAFERWHHDAPVTDAWAAWKARADIAHKRERQLTEVLLGRADELLSAVELDRYPKRAR